MRPRLNSHSPHNRQSLPQPLLIPVSISTRPDIRLTIYPSLFLCVLLSICLSLYLSVSLSVCLLHAPGLYTGGLTSPPSCVAEACSRIKIRYIMTAGTCNYVCM